MTRAKRWLTDRSYIVDNHAPTPADVPGQGEVEGLADHLDRWERGLDGANDTDAWQNRLARAILAAGYLSPEQAAARERQAGAAAAEDYDAVIGNPASFGGHWLRDRAERLEAGDE